MLVKTIIFRVTTLFISLTDLNEFLSFSLYSYDDSIANNNKIIDKCASNIDSDETNVNEKNNRSTKSENLSNISNRNKQIKIKRIPSFSKIILKKDKKIMSDLNFSRGSSPHFSPSKNGGKNSIFIFCLKHFIYEKKKKTQKFLSISGQLDTQTLHIHLSNQGFRTIRIDEASDVRQIISIIVCSISSGQITNSKYYALRLRHVLTKEIIWLPLDTSMLQVIAHIANPICSNAECQGTKQLQQTNQHNSKTVLNHSNSVWRAELRVRYVPNNLSDLYDMERITCHFYFDQCRQDYIQQNLPNIDTDIAIQLCCFGIRHYYRDTKQSSDKKHHIDYIEKEKGFSNFIPKSVIDSIKQKNLKKIIQTGYKKVYTYTEREYMLR